MAKKTKWEQSFNDHFILLSLVLLVAFFGLFTDHFLSLATLLAILAQLPALTVVTVGMTLVLILGRIDLSVGSLVALSGCVIGASVTKLGLPIWLSGFLGLLAGALIGFISGWVTTKLSVPAFVVTLGMLEVARGAAYLTSDSQTIFVGQSVQIFALPIPYLSLSYAFFFSIIVVGVTHFALHHSVIGRHIIAIGTNERSAKISGIEISSYIIGVFAFSGGLAGLGGLFNLAYLGSADPNAGFGFELSAIAAAVIGGTSLLGGRGSILGAFVGVVIITVLQNGLAQMGVSEPLKRLITGVVIIIAVILDRTRAKKTGYDS